MEKITTEKLIQVVRNLKKEMRIRFPANTEKEFNETILDMFFNAFCNDSISREDLTAITNELGYDVIEEVLDEVEMKKRKKDQDMAKEKLIKMANDMVEAQMEESGLPREDVFEVSTMCFVENYYHNEITKEELAIISEYLQTPLNMEEVDKEKAKRLKRVEYRLKHRAIKLLIKKKAKLSSNRYQGNGLNEAIIHSLNEDYQNGRISESLLKKAIELINNNKEGN